MMNSIINMYINMEHFRNGNISFKGFTALSENTNLYCIQRPRKYLNNILTTKEPNPKLETVY